MKPVIIIFSLILTAYSLLSNESLLKHRGHDHDHEPRYFCYDGYLHLPNGDRVYVGESDCRTAVLGEFYACVDGYLFGPNNLRDYEIGRAHV